MTHSFDVELAQRVGVNSAILYANIKFWCLKNKANNKNFFDGNYWTYNSVKAWQELFPYLGIRQIRTALKKLEDEGLILSGEYNSNAYDRTKWYCIVEFNVLTNGLIQKDQPISDIKPDIKPDIKNTKKEKPQPQNREAGEGDLTPKDVIDFYKENISSSNQKVKEAKAINQIVLKKIDLEDLLKALNTYADEVKRKKIDEQYVVNLVNFISDNIYKDYLKEEINLIPKDLIGVEFKIDDMEYQFKENGIFNWSKDFLITNEQNIKEYVELIREHRRSK